MVVINKYAILNVSMFILFEKKYYLECFAVSFMKSMYQLY